MGKNNIIIVNDGIENLDEYLENYEIKLNKNNQLQNINPDISLDFIEKYVMEKFEGYCLSKKYINNSYEMIWKCKCGHIFYSTYKRILKGYWNYHNGCYKDKQKHSIDEMRNIAKSRNGKCLSDKYNNTDQHLEWECSYKHRWKTSFTVIKNHWCPECSDKYSFGEKISRELLKLMFNEEFLSCRPSWLKYPKTNCPLEIDMYSNKLKIGFEYQGQQHYSFNKKFHKSIEDFNKQKERDEYKFTKCCELSIKLLYIPYYVKMEILQTYISELCEKNNIIIPNKNKINLSTINIYSNFQIERFKQIQEYINPKEGKCLNEIYEPIMKYQCKKGHIWEADSHKIINGTWCKLCYIESRKGYDIESINKFIDEYNCICISEKYQNVQSQLKFKCNTCNIEWENSLIASFDRIKQGYLCYSCFSIEELIKKIGDYNCICLSKQYVNKNSILTWKCLSCDKQWDCSRANINDRIQKSNYICLNCNKINNLNKIANKYNCVCLSKEYIYEKTIKWKCNFCNKEWQLGLDGMTARIRKKEFFCNNCKHSKIN